MPPSLPTVQADGSPLPTSKIPGVISLNALGARLTMAESMWRDLPEIPYLRLRCAELFVGQQFTPATIELLIAWFQVNDGLTADQARHLPLSEAVRRLRHVGDAPAPPRPPDSPPLAKTDAALASAQSVLTLCGQHLNLLEHRPQAADGKLSELDEAITRLAELLPPFGSEPLSHFEAMTLCRGILEHAEEVLNASGIGENERCLLRSNNDALRDDLNKIIPALVRTGEPQTTVDVRDLNTTPPTANTPRRDLPLRPDQLADLEAALTYASLNTVGYSMVKRWVNANALSAESPDLDATSPSSTASAAPTATRQGEGGTPPANAPPLVSQIEAVDLLRRFVAERFRDGHLFVSYRKLQGVLHDAGCETTKLNEMTDRAMNELYRRGLVEPHIDTSRRSKWPVDWWIRPTAVVDSISESAAPPVNIDIPSTVTGTPLVRSGMNPPFPTVHVNRRAAAEALLKFADLLPVLVATVQNAIDYGTGKYDPERGLTYLSKWWDEMAHHIRQGDETPPRMPEAAPTREAFTNSALDLEKTAREMANRFDPSAAARHAAQRSADEREIIKTLGGTPAHVEPASANTLANPNIGPVAKHDIEQITTAATPTPTPVIIDATPTATGQSEGGTPPADKPGKPARDPNQPSKDRQNDILAAIRTAGTPLMRAELVEAMKLRTEGKIGAHLAWMVSAGILINIPSRGYWPTGESVPE